MIVLSVQRFFVEVLFDGDDDAACVHISGAEQRAFAAKHAFVNFVLHLVQLSAQYEQIDASEREVGEVARRAGGGACSARHADVERRFFFRQVGCQFLRNFVHVDGLVFVDGKPETTKITAKTGYYSIPNRTITLNGNVRVDSTTNDKMITDELVIKL